MPAAVSRRTGGGARYSATARALHWITVAAVLLLVVMGVRIAFFAPEDEALKLRLYNIHESTGVTVFVLTALRLLWRAGHPPPPITPPLPATLALVAHLNHAALYALLLTMPVVGFVATNAWGFPFVWFGLIPFPVPIGQNEALAKVFSAIHFGMAITLVALVAAHVAGALYHHFLRRDDTLRRML